MLQALLAELGEERGMAGLVASIPYLADCVDDLNSASRPMRKFLEESSQISFGPGLFVGVDFLRTKFLDWKRDHGMRTNQISGEHVSELAPLMAKDNLILHKALLLGSPTCRCDPELARQRHHVLLSVQARGMPSGGLLQLRMLSPLPSGAWVAGVAERTP